MHGREEKLLGSEGKCSAQKILVRAGVCKSEEHYTCGPPFISFLVELTGCINTTCHFLGPEIIISKNALS